MSIKSLDPRITRAGISEDADKFKPLDTMAHWQTYEVFHQTKKGDRHIHVGSVHAPNEELAYLFAKEQYGRRYKCTSMWIVKTADVFTVTNDEEFFERNDEKIYREAGGYKVMDKINKFKGVK